MKELRNFVERENYGAYRREMANYIGPAVPLHSKCFSAVSDTGD